jgi:hypothetical protein
MSGSMPLVYKQKSLNQGRIEGSPPLNHIVLGSELFFKTELYKLSIEIIAFSKDVLLHPVS